MGGTILLADDSITIQKVVELTFGETDHRVVALSSGRELLRRLPEVRPDVILCDVVMPDLNGYEVCQTLKADPATLHIPLVLLTGTFEPFDRDRALAAGCDAIVTKPFEGRELINVVEDLLRRSQAPAVVEPEPSFFPGLGVPEGTPGLEFTTTGFDQMVPEPPVEPQIPEHGIEMTGVGSRPAEPALASEPGFAFGGPTPEVPAAGIERPASADDSWIERIDSESPEVGPMQGEFFEQPAATPPLVERPDAEPAADRAAPMVLPPWEESAALQTRAAETPFAAPAEEPAGEEAPQVVTAGLADEAEALPVAAGTTAFGEFGPPPAWEEAVEPRLEPVLGTWPEPPAPPVPPQVLQPLNPARESIAAAWDGAEEAPPEAAREDAHQPVLALAGDEPHPEPGFDLVGGPVDTAAFDRPPLAAPEAAAVMPAGSVAEASIEPAAVEPEPPVAPVAEEAVAAPAVAALEQGTPEAAVAATAPAVPAPPPQPELAAASAAPAEESVAPGVVPVEEAPEPIAAPAEFAPPYPPVPETAAPGEETEPVPPAPLAVPGEAVPPTGAAVAPLGDELVERVVERVLARISQTSPAELTEDQITAVAERAVQLIPPPPPPDLPPLSYELEESDIQRVAARVVEILPPPSPPKLPEEEVEYVAQRAAQLVPAPPPVALSDSEIDRVTDRVLLALPEPPPPVLPESEIARVLERVKASLAAAEAAAPAAVPGELPEAAVERIAQRVLELATPIIERIAWEVLPDMAEMLIRRRIEELEREAEA